MNRSSDSILSVYSDARAEYTKQLCVFLVPAYFQFFIELLEKAKYDMVKEPKRALWQFQNYLNEIHDWNMEKVHSEINKINTNSGCDYLEDLLTAVFIAHTKVLTAIRLSANKKKIEINVPKIEHFLFKVLCETSKLLWSSTYLFRDGIPGIEKQQNYRSIEQIINEGILQAVRSLVPVKSILKDFVNSDTTDDLDDSDNEKENDSNDIESNNILQQPMSTSQTLDIPNVPVISDIPNIPVISDIPNVPVISDIPNVPVISDIPDNELSIDNKTLESNIKNEIIQPLQQTIIIDDKPTVSFGEYNTVFDTENPNNSELVYEDDNDDNEDDIPVLEILDDQGTPLSDTIDFDEINGDNYTNLDSNDYEEL